MSQSHEYTGRRRCAGVALLATLLLTTSCSTEGRPDKNDGPEPGPEPSVSCMPMVRQIGSLILTPNQVQWLEQGKRPEDVDFGVLTKGTGYTEEDVDMFRMFARVGTLNERTANKVAETIDGIVAPDKWQSSTLVLLSDNAPELGAGEVRLDAGVPDGCRNVTLPPEQTVAA